MSILIKGAKMPKNCGYCFFNDFNICQVEHFTVADAVYHEERHENCPLVEIPPHGRLIDADKLKDNIPETKVSAFEICSECGLLDEAEVEDFIDGAPTVIESEVEE